jgi:DNA-binding winged helix-turn-helix (wHTH) protein
MAASFEGPARELEFGPFRLDPARRELRRGGHPLVLTPRVFDTLLALVERRARVAGKTELMAALWPDRAVEEANLTQNVFVLRKLLREREDGARYIATVPRRGYRFVAEVREVEEAERPPAPPPTPGGWRTRALLAALVLGSALAAAALAPLRSQASAPPPEGGTLPLRVETEEVRVVVQIVDARTTRPLWSRSYEARPAALRALPAEIAGSLGAELEKATRAGRAATPASAASRRP